MHGIFPRKFGHNALRSAAKIIHHHKAGVGLFSAFASAVTSPGEAVKLLEAQRDMTAGTLRKVNLPARDLNLHRNASHSAFSDAKNAVTRLSGAWEGNPAATLHDNATCVASTYVNIWGII